MHLGRYGNKIKGTEDLILENINKMYSLKDLKKVYSGKKVLVTGHTGFKGAYVVLLLKYLGAKVYGYALKEEKGSIYELLKKEIKSDNGKIVEGECYGDIRDFNKLKNYIKKVSPDFILHMAAQPLVLKGYDEPLYTYEVNVMGTANLMQAINEVYCMGKSKKILSVLNVTTDKVYENNDLSNYAFKEKDKLCGRDPYANSKSCSELVTYAYKKSFFDKNVCISTARAGNVIGGGDMNANRIIPDCYRAIKNNKKMLVRNPLSVRPYQYVLEPLIIYLNIMVYQYKDKKYEGNYNIGPDKKACLYTKDLVEKFFSDWNKRDGEFDCCHSSVKVVYNQPKKNAKHEAAFLRLDNSLIKKVFNYKEIFNIKKTMQYTADVYKLILFKKPLIPYIYNIFTNL